MQAVTRQCHGLHHGSGLEVFVHLSLVTAGMKARFVPKAQNQSFQR
jgi:hypothetical protein